MNNTKAITIALIALKEMQIRNLKPQVSSDLNFHRVACWRIQRALSGAYDAGHAAATAAAATAATVDAKKKRVDTSTVDVRG